MGDNLVRRNYLYNLSYQLLIVLTPFITTPYISRVLGEEGIGAYGWTQSICTYFVLTASLGISMYGQREIAYHRDSVEERSRIFWELIILRGVSVIGSIFFYFVLFVLQGRYSDLFLIQGLDVLAVIFDISWLLQGMEDFRRVVGRNAAVKCISVACIFLFVKKPSDLPLYALCLSGSSFLGNLSLWLYVPRYICRVAPGSLRIRRHFMPNLHLFIPQIAIQVYGVMDKTMLGSLNPSIAQNGFYTQAQKITKVSTALVTSMGTVMMPRVSYLYVHNEIGHVRESLYQMFRFAAFMGCGLAFGIAGIARGMVPWFYGAGFEPVEYILYCLCPTIFLIATSNVSGIQCLVPMKRQRAFNLSVIAGSIVNLVINAALIPSRGAIGACVGTVAAEFTVTAVQLYCLRGFLSPWRVLSGSVRNIAAGLTMMLALFFIGGHLPVGILSTMLEVAIGFTLYCVLLLASGDEMVRGTLGKCLELLRKTAGI